MKKIFTLILFFITLNAFAINPFIGEYVGKVDAEKGYYKGSPDLSFVVYKQGDTYTIEAYTLLWRRAHSVAQFKVKEEDAALSFAGHAHDNCYLEGEIADGKITGVATSKISENESIKTPFTINQLERKPPTLMLSAPKDAIILFDGSKESAQNWNNFTWTINKDGSATIAKEDPKHDASISTKETFAGDFNMHIEFMLPDETDSNLGQWRGNSGVFLNRFEFQILESFGSAGIWNECGAVYKVHPPLVNASLPPEHWQTFDIEFQAGEVKDGKIIRYPRATLYHNGIRIHSDVELNEITAHISSLREVKAEDIGAIRISLQDHGSKVNFRNIWIQQK